MDIEKVPQLSSDYFDQVDDPILNLIPDEDEFALYRMARDEAADIGPESIQESARALFSQDIDIKEIRKTFSLGKQEVSSGIILANEDIFPKRLNKGDVGNVAQPVFCVFAILYKQVNGKKEYFGHFQLSFGRNSLKEVVANLLSANIAKTGQGAGLDLQCQIEEFCLHHNVLTMQLTAMTQPDLGDIGAYYWAQSGFDFAYEADKSYIVTLYRDYLRKNRLTIIGNPSLNRPSDIACSEALDSQGKKIRSGKNFLAGSILQWEGIKDIRTDSSDSKVFRNYLRRKARPDLAKRYYAKKN